MIESVQCARETQHISHYPEMANTSCLPAAQSFSNKLWIQSAVTFVRDYFVANTQRLCRGWQVIDRKRRANHKGCEQSVTSSVSSHVYSVPRRIYPIKEPEMLCCPIRRRGWRWMRVWYRLYHFKVSRGDEKTTWMWAGGAILTLI